MRQKTLYCERCGRKMRIAPANFDKHFDRDTGKPVKGHIVGLYVCPSLVCRIATFFTDHYRYFITDEGKIVEEWWGDYG
jgi:hypothetical protein